MRGSSNYGMAAVPHGLEGHRLPLLQLLLLTCGSLLPLSNAKLQPREGAIAVAARRPPPPPPPDSWKSRTIYQVRWPPALYHVVPSAHDGVGT